MPGKENSSALGTPPMETGENRQNIEGISSLEPWRPKQLVWAGMFLILMAGGALWVDRPLAWWIQQQKDPEPPEAFPTEGRAPPRVWWGFKIPRPFRRVLTWAEGFGHGIGVLLVGLLIYQLDPANRRRLVRALSMGLTSGLSADGMKLLVGRLRPRAFDLTESIGHSFTGLFPLLEGGSGGQSFPSAHVATAVGWALGLSWLYPRGKWMFVFLAGLVLCQRVEALAHFLSDALAGAAVGCWIGALFLPGGWLSQPFSRWENRPRAGIVHPRAE